MEKENNNKYWLKSGILNVLQNMSGVLFGFGGFFFLVRLLSDIDFGLWSVFMATTTIFNVFRDGLLRSAVVKFLSGASDEDKPKIITSSFTIDGILTFCMIIINLSIAHFFADYWDSPQVITLFYLYNIVY